MQDLQDEIKAYAEELGTTKAARVLGLTPDSVSRLAAGLKVRAGTMAIAKAWYAERVKAKP